MNIKIPKTECFILKWMFNRENHRGKKRWPLAPTLGNGKIGAAWERLDSAAGGLGGIPSLPVFWKGPGFDLSWFAADGW